MKKLLTKGQIAILVIFSVLIIDQVIKIWIKTHMYWHESIRITDWFYIYFTENNGMAFGMELFGKLFLTIPNRCSRINRMVSIQNCKKRIKDRIYYLCIINSNRCIG